MNTTRTSMLMIGTVAAVCAGAADAQQNPRKALRSGTMCYGFANVAADDRFHVGDTIAARRSTAGAQPAARRAPSDSTAGAGRPM